MRRQIASTLLGAYVLTLALANFGVGYAERVTAAAGLHQAWSVFAPKPVQHEVVLEAEVRYPGGGHTQWRPPRRHPTLALVGYHIETWKIRLARDSDSDLWRPAAAWIARRHTSGARRPVSVTLRRRWRPVPRPGESAEPRIWSEFDFYTLDLRTRD